MTGFSRNRIDTRMGSIFLEISSVNHRNQEITVKTPRELSLFERVVQQEVRTASRRGKIQIRLEISWDPVLRAARIDHEVLKGYAAEITRISTDFGFQRDVAIEQLLTLPGVMVLPLDNDGNIENELGEAISDLLAAGISKWDSMRALEGSHLQQVIVDHLECFWGLIQDIGDKWPVAKETAANLLKDKIRLLLESGGFECDEGRIAQEIVMLNDKWDITEEMARLASHVDKFRGIVHNDVLSGKTLDFLVQEMNREINTIASKVQDAGIRWISVEAKSSLESIREQIQNVE